MDLSGAARWAAYSDHVLALGLAGGFAWMFRSRHKLESARWLMFAAGTGLTLRYLLWRWLYTLNLSSPAAAAVSVSLFMAELYALASWSLFYFQSSDRREVKSCRMLPPKEQLPTVDVMITIYDEPTMVLEGTLVGATALDYPKDKLNVYVLDDGKREEVRKMAAEFKVHYLTRPDNRDAKAGNINHALLKTKGEYILFLDTDHVPTRGAVKRMLSEFDGPEVAFVQSPHHFDNPDSFQSNLKMEGELLDEQGLFFHVIMPGRERHNATIYAGSAGMMRRKALESIGGFKAATAIEDFQTSQQLHADGWTSRYVPEVLVSGLAPESLAAYLTQRMRWVRGGVQMFVLDNPLFKRGLSAWQRFHYFASLMYFFHAWPRVIFLLAPLTYLIWHMPPINSSAVLLSAYFLPHFAVQLTLFLWIAGGHRNPFWSEVYETTGAFHLAWAALETLIRPTGVKFAVTPKGAANDAKGFQWRLVRMQGVVLFLTLGGMLYGAWHMTRFGVAPDAIVMSLLWAAFNCVILAAAMRVAAERPWRRLERRVPGHVSVRVDSDRRSRFGISTDLSPGGVALRVEGAGKLAPVVQLKIRGHDEDVFLDGEVLACDPLPHGEVFASVVFQNMNAERRRAVIRMMYSPCDTWDDVYRPPARLLRSFATVAKAALSREKKNAPRAARWPRLAPRADCTVARDNGRSVRGRAIGWTDEEMRVSLPERLAFNESVTLRLRGASDKWIVRRGVVAEELKDNAGHAYRVALVPEPVAA